MAKITTTKESTKKPVKAEKVAEKKAEKKTENAPIKLHLIEPRETEKTYMVEKYRTYVFPVNSSISKQSIADLIEKEFNVKVDHVRVLNRKGKKMLYMKSKRASAITTHANQKYAYVTLKEGSKIKLSSEQTETEAEKKENK